MTLDSILQQKGLVSDSQLVEARALQAAEGLRLDRALIQLGHLGERQLLEVMSEQLHLPVADLSAAAIPS